jgi:hypothetical protein
MNESAWLAAADPDPMLNYLRAGGGRASERKLRLLACACCRHVWELLPDERSRSAVAVIERYADGRATPRELGAARLDALRVSRGRRGRVPYLAASNRIGDTLWNVLSVAAETLAGVAVDTAQATGSSQAAAWNAALAAAARDQAALVREIFGNPFRPAKVDPAWLAWHRGIVERLARAIYDGHAFDRMPVLADALEEAGCTDADILDHCRQPVGHVRGCWALDLLLGRE